MTQALALAPGAADATDKNIYESLALRGDISALGPQDKTVYMQKLCESLGLNPLTQPFTPLKLNGKEILYASRGATDQLSDKRKLTREIIKTETISGVYVATCKVSAPDGRFDVSTGAVTIEGLKGDALANALMKAETKAKRRATLSFCGLGFLDETELETIPENRIERIPTKNQLTQSPAPVLTIEPLSIQEKSWRAEIEAVYKKFEMAPQAALAKFDANSDVRATAIREVRKMAIKRAIASDAWGLTEEGTTEFLNKHGIISIDDATDAALERCVSELRDLGNL